MVAPMRKFWNTLREYVLAVMSPSDGDIDVLGKKYRFIVICLKFTWLIFMIACFAALVFHSKMIVIDFAEENTVTDVILEPTDQSELLTTQCVHINVALGLSGEFDKAQLLFKKAASIDQFMFNYLARLSQSFEYFLEKPYWIDYASVVEQVVLNNDSFSTTNDYQRYVEERLLRKPLIRNMNILPLIPASADERIDGLKNLRAMSSLVDVISPLSGLANLQLVRQSNAWFICFSVSSSEITVEVQGFVMKNLQARQLSINSYPTTLSELNGRGNPMWYTYRFEKIDMYDIEKVDRLKYASRIGTQVHMRLYDKYKKRNNPCVAVPDHYKIALGKGNEFCRSACFTKGIEDRFKCSYLDKPASFFNDYVRYDEVCNTFDILGTLLMELDFHHPNVSQWLFKENGQYLCERIKNDNQFISSLTTSCQKDCEAIKFCQEWDLDYSERLISLTLANMKECGLQHNAHATVANEKLVNVESQFLVIKMDNGQNCWAGGDNIRRQGLYPLNKARNHKPCIRWQITSFGHVGNHGYCSNPNGDIGPWCYTSYQNYDVFAWDYCLNYTCTMKYMARNASGAPQKDTSGKCVRPNGAFLDNTCFTAFGTPDAASCRNDMYFGDRQTTKNQLNCTTPCRNKNKSIPQCKIMERNQSKYVDCFYDCSVLTKTVLPYHADDSDLLCWNDKKILDNYSKVILYYKEVTRYNIKCINWLDLIEVHFFNSIGSHGINHSYCAIPNEDIAPWCFIRSTSGELTWQYCFNYTCDFKQRNMTRYLTETTTLPINATDQCLSNGQLGRCWNSTNSRCQGPVYVGQRFQTKNDDICSSYCEGRPGDPAPSCLRHVPPYYVKQFCFHLCTDIDNNIGILDGEYCYHTDLQQNSRTIFNTTRTGKQCLNWIDILEHHYFDTANHSYCINPDGDIASWCFFRNSSGDIDWEYCVNSTCDLIKLMEQNEPVKMHQNNYCERIKDGKICWNSEDPKCIRKIGYHHPRVQSIVREPCDRYLNIDNSCKFTIGNIPTCSKREEAKPCYTPCSGGCIQEASVGNFCWDSTVWAAFDSNTTECVSKGTIPLEETTVDGHRCLPWNISVSLFSHLGSSKQCANPDERNTGPWCYYKIGSRITAMSCLDTCIYNGILMLMA